MYVKNGMRECLRELRFVKDSGQRLLKEGLGRLVGAAFAVTPTSAEGFGGAREYGLRCARSRVRTGERKGDVSGH